MESSPQPNTLTVPLAIVVAGLLIAGAIFLSKGGNETPQTERADKNALAANTTQEQTAALTIRPVTGDDHIRGNPNADIVIVEYSDTECPFCKRFHTTMQQIVAEYGKSGKVAWVYRHFPIVNLHPKAPKEAEATECAAELGGSAKFWEYIDRLFELTPANNGLDVSELPKIAVDVKLPRSQFESCLQSGKYANRVQSDYQDGVTSGANGTPYNVLILKRAPSVLTKQPLLALYAPFRDQRTGLLPISFSDDGVRVALSGAMPFDILKQTINHLLK